MFTFLLVLHFIVTLLLIGIVLIQRHEGGGLSAGLSSAANNLVSSRGQANILTKATAILMIIFVVNCLVMAKIAKTTHKHTSIFNSKEQELTTTGSEFSRVMNKTLNAKKDEKKQQDENSEKSENKQ